MSRKLGQAPPRRLTEASPQCEEPLSTIQNTRSAEAEGCSLQLTSEGLHLHPRFGGKDRRSAGARSILQSVQPLVVKALAPLTGRLGAGVQPLGDLLVGGIFGGQQHYSGAYHLPVGSGVGACSLVEDGVLLFGRLDAVSTLGEYPFSLLWVRCSRKYYRRTKKLIKEVQSPSTSPALRTVLD